MEAYISTVWRRGSFVWNELTLVFLHNDCYAVSWLSASRQWVSEWVRNRDEDDEPAAAAGDPLSTLPTYCPGLSLSVWTLKPNPLKSGHSTTWHSRRWYSTSCLLFDDDVDHVARSPADHIGRVFAICTEEFPMQINHYKSTNCEYQKTRPWTRNGFSKLFYRWKDCN